MRRRISIAPLLLGMLGGCSGSLDSAIRHEPSVSAKLALETYDTNSDGVIDKKELSKSPALQSALSRIDSDRDGSLSAQEIQNRLETYQEHSQRIGTVVRLACKRKPVVNATVVLEPESFLGDNLPVYEGTSDDRGKVTLTHNGEKVQMIPVSLYRVRIQKDGNAAETIRGCEIADDVPDANSLVFDLK